MGMRMQEEDKSQRGTSGKGASDKGTSSLLDEACNRNNEKFDDERLYAGWLATSWSDISGDEIWFAKKPAGLGHTAGGLRR